MSTRCFIGIKSETETVGIYCHNDGYPRYTGNILLNNYNTEEAVRALVEMGGASFVAKTVEESRFYHRDNGEALDKCDVSAMPSLDYGYIFSADTGWTWYKWGKRQGKLTAEALARLEELYPPAFPKGEPALRPYGPLSC